MPVWLRQLEQINLSETTEPSFERKNAAKTLHTSN